eukprot:gene7440-8227_t
MQFFSLWLCLVSWAITSEAFHLGGGWSRRSVASTLASSQQSRSLARYHPLPSTGTALRPAHQLPATLMDDLETGPQLNLRKRHLIEEYVEKRGGKRVIQRILIANNGMAATKSILSMRQWAYMVLGDEEALEFIVMATRDDLNANAEFIRLADAFVEVPSGSNKNNYANVDLIVSIAEAEKVDAVWPGWGHASENPRLPASLKAKGIQFIGPTSSVMAALGDKVSANILAQTAHVPSIPWSGDGIVSQLNEEGVIPKEIFDQACVFNVEQAATMAEKIGYPVMIKASEGGGGKGIRKANNADELRTNFIQVQNEVPGSPIFMMQLCTNARHLEVQIVGDEYGNAVALNGRDCSTQRRFQKIFEEGPPIVAPPEVFHEMELAAQRLTQSIGYIGAGTVEYLYNPSQKKFFFLELNPRLQVEHPVTEGLTGTNLPAVQLQVAMGISLDRIPDVRAFFGRDPEGVESIDFLKDRYVYPKHHIIAARITAENPDEGFKPSSGRIERVKFQSTPRVWGYFSVGANGGIHEYADSQFGHIFSTGATREEARKSLVLALKEMDVRGDIRTTIEYLIKLLETQAFKENTLDTSWLDQLIREKSVHVVEMEDELVAMSTAIYKAYTTTKGIIADFVASLSRGQTGLSALNSMSTFPVEVVYNHMRYSFQATMLGPQYYKLVINGQEMEARIREQPDGSLLVHVNGESYQLYGQEEALGLRMKINGRTVMIPNVYNPSELRSDVTGKIVRYLHPDRSFVNKGEAYVEVEAMKMIMALRSTESGVITHHLPSGSIISAGELLASLQLQDPSRVKAINAFVGNLGFMPAVAEKSIHEIEELLLFAAEGYEVDNVEELLTTYFQGATLQQSIDLVQKAFQRYASQELPFLPTAPVAGAEGSSNNARDDATIISSLIKSNRDSLQTLVPLCFAHKRVAARTKVMNAFLRQLEFILPQRYNLPLTVLRGDSPITVAGQTAPVQYSALYNTLSQLLQSLDRANEVLVSSMPLYYNTLFLKLRQLFDVVNMPPFSSRMEALVQTLANDDVPAEELAGLPNIAVSVDLLVVILMQQQLLPSGGASAVATSTKTLQAIQAAGHSYASIREKAMELYIRRVYRAHRINNIAIETDAATGTLTAKWEFSLREVVDDAQPPLPRYGYMQILPYSMEQITPENMAGLVNQAKTYFASTPARPSHQPPLNIFHLAFSTNGRRNQEEESAYLEGLLAPHKETLYQSMSLRMVNYLLVHPEEEDNHQSHLGPKVSYYTYLSETGYQEDVVARDMRATLPQLLELPRLTKNHELVRLPSVGRNAFLFLGKEKSFGGKDKSSPEVLFLRANSHSTDTTSLAGADRIVLMALDEIERVMLDPRVSSTASSRLFVHVVPEMEMSVESCIEQFQRIMDQLITKYATRLLKLRVDEIEVKMRVVEDEEDEKGVVTKKRAAVPIRLIASSSTGGWLTREAYREYIDPITGLTDKYCSIVLEEREDSSTKKRRLARVSDLCVLDPYPTSTTLQKKRSMARKVGSTYATDFLALLEVAVIKQWQGYQDSTNLANVTFPSHLFSFDELSLPLAVYQKVDLSAENIHHIPTANIVEEVRRGLKRFPGENKIGMLAWHVTLKTPHYPQGREVVVIANDVTVQSGSFGIQEDYFFNKISQYARYLGLPRIFISCNSGARIGLVDDLKPKFKVAWKDENSPAAGFDYLYLTQEDYQSLPANTVEAHPIVIKNSQGEAEEVRYKLISIIGQSNGIGVENLRGSGLIAGETSRAYEEIFTLSYVTGRSVGIGAYLNRLGQRVIQMQQGPMILTGYSALNKLLGKEVYTSQDQLGGPQIMHPNGIAHQIVRDDEEGMNEILRWLSYVPQSKSKIAPILPYSHPFIDRVDREIGFLPTKTPYDPRHMLAGKHLEDGSYLSGFLDKDSFTEYLAGWGKSVVVGRGRLGGINVGVIAVETRQVEQRIPADPGNADSREAILPQAGQVWYPDSAFKTAQAIQDFNRGENLPLIILANWRGFSGGTRDMYGEILKYGAMIVDALRGYKHPVFIYIPPNSELRGGAWVVIDPTINIHKIQMFADVDSRGGILEPPGICEVKYRPQEQIQTMHRLDPVLRELDEAFGQALEKSEKDKLSQDIQKREKALSPLYLSLAHEFADLHDRAGRMKAKGCIQDILEWKSARKFFYWRILKRQREEFVKEEMVRVSRGAVNLDQAHEKLHAAIPKDLTEDRAVVEWFRKNEKVLDDLIASCQV